MAKVSPVIAFSGKTSKFIARFLNSIAQFIFKSRNTFTYFDFNLRMSKPLSKAISKIVSKSCT